MPIFIYKEVASVIGISVPSFSGIMHRALYYRYLEKDKPQALQRTKGNFDASMSLLSPAKSELQLWIKNVVTAYNVINHPQSQHQITTDASLTGWGLNLQGCPHEEIGLIQSRNTTSPDWPKPAALQLLRGKPVHLEAGKDLLQLSSHPKETHPIWHKLSFLVCLLPRRD